MAGKPAHKYFSFQALTRAYFIHSMPIFFFSAVQSPQEGSVVHSVTLSWGMSPSCCCWTPSRIISTFKDWFSPLSEEEIHMWTRVGAFSMTLGVPGGHRARDVCTPHHWLTAQGVGAKLSTQHWSGAEHGVKAGLPNPFCTSCIPNHACFTLCSCPAWGPGCSSVLPKYLCFSLGCSKYRPLVIRDHKGMD